MIQKALKLILAHCSEYFERLKELNAAQEIPLDGLFNDTSVGLAIYTGNFAILQTYVSHQVRLGMNESSLSETFTGAKLTHIFKKPNLLRVSLLGDYINRALMFSFFY